MLKKGFTLVELLGVIVVLGIILVVTVPSVIDTLRRANANENAAYLTRLYTGAETYLEMNRESYDQLDTVGGRVDIPIKALMDEGLVKTLGTNPATGSMILATHTITATKQADGTIAYAIYANDTNIKSYVQGGLIAHFDAINNVAFGHSNTTNVWNDLTNYHSDGTLSNFNYTATSGWTNNGLKFDGINDIVKTSLTGYDFSTLKAGQAFTIGITFTTNTISGWSGLISNMNVWGTGGLNLQYGFNQSIGVGMGTYVVLAPTPVASTTYSVYAVYNGASMSVTRTGSGSVTTAAYSVLPGEKIMTIGCFYTIPSLLTDGTIRSIVIYNRALNDTEKNANIALDNIRYR